MHLEEHCYPCSFPYQTTPPRPCVLSPTWQPPASPPCSPVPLACPAPASPAPATGQKADALALIPVKLDVHCYECPRCAWRVQETRSGALPVLDTLLSVALHLTLLTDLADARRSRLLTFADIVQRVAAALGLPLPLTTDDRQCAACGSLDPLDRWFDVVLWTTWPPALTPSHVAYVQARTPFEAIEYLMRYCWCWQVARAAARACTSPVLTYHAHHLRTTLYSAEEWEVQS